MRVAGARTGYVMDEILRMMMIIWWYPTSSPCLYPTFLSHYGKANSVDDRVIELISGTITV